MQARPGTFFGIERIGPSATTASFWRTPSHSTAAIGKPLQFAMSIPARITPKASCGAGLPALAGTHDNAGFFYSRFPEPETVHASGRCRDTPPCVAYGRKEAGRGRDKPTGKVIDALRDIYAFLLTMFAMGSHAS